VLMVVVFQKKGERDVKFGKLAITGERQTIDGRDYRLCRCECGNEKLILEDSLWRKKRPTRSCGCLRGQHIGEGSCVSLDLAGQKFGRLIAIRVSRRDKYRQNVWECICDCGNTAEVKASSLKSGHTRSCGCLKNGQEG
jgi:hypothetical protein